MRESFVAGLGEKIVNWGMKAKMKLRMGNGHDIRKPNFPVNEVQ